MHEDGLRNAQRIARKICRSYIDKDMYAVARLAYWDAYLTYNKKDDFNNWLFTKVKQYVIDELRKSEPRAYNIDDFHLSNNGLEKCVIARDILNKLYASLSDKNKVRFLKRFVHDMTWKEIYKSEGISERALHESFVNIRKQTLKIMKRR